MNRDARALADENQFMQNDVGIALGFPSKDGTLENTGKCWLTSFREDCLAGHPMRNSLWTERDLWFDAHSVGYCAIRNALWEHVFLGPEGW